MERASKEGRVRGGGSERRRERVDFVAEVGVGSSLQQNQDHLLKPFTSRKDEGALAMGLRRGERERGRERGGGEGETESGEERKERTSVAWSTQPP
jgi:hypothetical protein